MGKKRKVVLPNEILFDRVKELVAEGHSITFRVKGNSMNPFLMDGRDEVVISSFREKDIRPGVIILAKDIFDRVMLHRVIGVRGGIIEMMGDGNCYGTEISDFGRIAGIVTGVVRNGQRISCRSKGWNFFSSFWNIARPVRRWLLAVWRRILRKI